MESALESCVSAALKERFRLGKGWTRKHDEKSASHNRCRRDVSRDVFFVPDTCSRLALLCAGPGSTTGSDELGEGRRARKVFNERSSRGGSQQRRRARRADDLARSGNFACGRERTR